MDKGDVHKGGTAVGSIKLSKSAPEPSVGVVPVPESEIGTEADLGVEEEAPAGRPQDDLGLQLSGSSPTGAAFEAPPVAQVELKNALPLYRFPGSGEGQEPRPAPRSRSAVKPPSGDHREGDAQSPLHRETPVGPVTGRKETLSSKIAEHKTPILVALGVIVALLLALFIYSSAQSSRQKAAETERLQKLSGQQ